MNLILLGYRGCGKTSVGRAVAERVGWAFVDLDEAVREQFGGRTIAQVWATDGEPAFRAAEVAALREAVAGDRQVIALGGGTVMQAGAEQALRASGGRVVYLRAGAEVLHQRIHADAGTTQNRPALTGQGGGLDEVRAVLAEREPVYRAVADEVIEVDGLSVDAIAARLALSL